MQISSQYSEPCPLLAATLAAQQSHSCHCQHAQQDQCALQSNADLQQSCLGLVVYYTARDMRTTSDKTKSEPKLHLKSPKIQIFIMSQRSLTNSIDFKHILCCFLSAGSRYTKGKTLLMFSQPDLSCSYKISNFCSGSKTCIIHEPSAGTETKTSSNENHRVGLLFFFFVFLFVFSFGVKELKNGVNPFSFL